jgi:hypothetical protein
MTTLTIDVETTAFSFTFEGEPVVEQDGELLVPARVREVVDTGVVRHDTPLEVVIAAVCHEANRQYCRSIGDDSQVPWSQASGGIQASAVQGVRDVISGEASTPEQAHERWMAFKRDQGWVYGPEKSEVAKTHPCLRPYGELPLSQRTKDRLFMAVATALLEPSER